MTPAEALADIRGLAQAGRVSYTKHALDRMDERSATRNDVEHALRNAARCAWQANKGTWKTFGADLAGEELVVAVVIQGGLLVVTVF